jgi:hypothetical protein
MKIKIVADFPHKNISKDYVGSMQLSDRKNDHCSTNFFLILVGVKIPSAVTFAGENKKFILRPIPTSSAN